VSDPATGWINKKKKTLSACERNEEDRLTYLARLMGVDVHKLVFVDESGFHLGMLPAYGRSPKGERCHAQPPRNRGENTNLIAALSVHGVQATMTLEGTVDAEIFDLFVEHTLLPTLHSGQIVIWDNYKIHKSARTRQLIETQGCQVICLPTYSPDLNPIEQAFSKIKAFVRAAKVLLREALDAAIVQAINTISLHDILGWFRHAGYTYYRYQ
jgi:transposase